MIEGERLFEADVGLGGERMTARHDQREMVGTVRQRVETAHRHDVAANAEIGNAFLETAHDLRAPTRSSTSTRICGLAFRNSDTGLGQKLDHRRHVRQHAHVPARRPRTG